MPLFDRRCSNCNHTEEVYEPQNFFQSITACPVCNLDTWVKLASAPHIDSRSLNITSSWIEQENRKCVKTHEPKILSTKNKQIFT